MKFGNLFIRNNFKITQTNHEFDNAIDCIGDSFDVYAPIDMRIDRQEFDGLSSWFRGYTDRYEIRFVHCRLYKTGYFKRGEKIGTYNLPNEPIPNHVHWSVKDLKTGIWLNPMEYLDRSINLQLSTAFRADQQFYKNWSTWGDKLLNIKNDNMNEIIARSGWGVSNLAKEAGYADWMTESRWQAIAQLNGFARWQDLQNEFVSGRAVGKSYLVRASSENTTEKIIVESSESKELKKALEEKKELQKKLLEIESELDAKATEFEQKLEEERLKVELQLGNDIEALELQLRALQEQKAKISTRVGLKEAFYSQREEILESSQGFARESAILISNFIDNKIPSGFKPLFYRLVCLGLSIIIGILSVLDPANIRAEAVVIVVGLAELLNQVLYYLKKKGEKYDTERIVSIS